MASISRSSSEIFKTYVPNMRLIIQYIYIYVLCWTVDACDSETLSSLFIQTPIMYTHSFNVWYTWKLTRHISTYRIGRNLANQLRCLQPIREKLVQITILKGSLVGNYPPPHLPRSGFIWLFFGYGGKKTKQWHQWHQHDTIQVYFCDEIFNTILLYPTKK